MAEPYRRVLLKLSGESFGGGKPGVDPIIVASVAKQIAAVVATGAEVAVVVGGGNYFRGAELQRGGYGPGSGRLHGHVGHSDELAGAAGLPREAGRADPRGAVCDHDGPCSLSPTSSARRAAPEKGRVVIFSAGSGMPYFSTDTVAAQRALEIKAQILLMGKNGVDGVYDADPKTNPDARRYDELTYDEFLAKDLKVADATAISLARDNKLDMLFFGLDDESNIGRAVAGERIGTWVHA